MKKENKASGAWKQLQRNTPSNESLDGFAAVVGVWLALRRAEMSEREALEACERVGSVDAPVAATKTGKESSTSEGYFGATRETSTSTAFSVPRQASDGDAYSSTLCCTP